MKQTGLILFAAIIALSAGILSRHWLSSSATSGPTPMPSFTLPDLTGKPHDSDEWQGKIRVINFWATWCPPCRKEMPGLIAFQQEWANRGVVVLGIAIDDARAVNEYSKGMTINYPILIANDTGARLARAFGDSMEAVPFTVIVNQQGQIIYRKPGEATQAELAAIIAPLLVKPEAGL